jgi:LmbE family N-acetylglucosaminyl deacetylase
VIIVLSIGGVDGETDTTIRTKSLKHALRVLEREDHEGSSIAMSIEAETPDEVYNMLRQLMEKE